jgi:hypothetical protein
MSAQQQWLSAVLERMESGSRRITIRSRQGDALGRTDIQYRGPVWRKALVTPLQVFACRLSA